MKVTKGQFNKLLSQHTGTGYIIIKTSDNSIQITDIGIARNGEWYVGLDGVSLSQGMNRIAKELIKEA